MFDIESCVSSSNDDLVKLELLQQSPAHRNAFQNMQENCPR